MNNIITLNDIENTQAYTITITTLIDKENTGIDTDIKEYERSYTVPSVNEYGISIGTITANQNSSDSRKVDLLFVSSYRLNEIDMISYTIYNTSGYSRTGQVDFLPTQINSDDEVYYRFPLDDRLSDYGRYYIEIQFIMDNEVIIKIGDKELHFKLKSQVIVTLEKVFGKNIFEIFQGLSFTSMERVFWESLVDKTMFENADEMMDLLLSEHTLMDLSGGLLQDIAVKSGIIKKTDIDEESLEDVKN